MQKDENTLHLRQINLFKERSMNKMKKSMMLVVLTLLVGFSANVNAQDMWKGMNPNETTKKYSTLLLLINNFYVDTVNMPHLVEKAIVATLRDLDPHSTYISKKDLEEAEAPLQGSFEGIGITFQLFKDTILVVAPVPGGPSDKVGIMAGDKILKVNGEKAYGPSITNEWVMSHLRGKKGTKVEVSVYRKGVDHLIDFTIVRDKIPLKSLDAAFMLNKNTGYIKLGRFASTSHEEFNQALDSLKKQGLKNLIFDLRGNPGGYLSAAQQIASEFLPKGKLIVYTKGEHSPRQNYYAMGNGHFPEGKLIVLINEGSASASEITSGALQDWDRALLVGRRSFGKGLVQRPFRLPDGSVIRLTVARYYTPSGRWIQKPYNDGVKAYYNDIERRLQHGELLHADSIHFPDSLKYQTSMGRTVYGGGGIMPDVFVPWDSTRYNELYSALIRKGVFNTYVNEYLDGHRATLHKQYKSLNQYIKNYKVTEADFKVFLQDAKKVSVAVVPEELDPNINFIKLQIKALIARDLFNQNAYYEIVSSSDRTVNRALQIMKSNKLFEQMDIQDTFPNKKEDPN
ncbi:MAG: S41 family peptidase [Bacteroidales bacterium]|nr:S41 family peptidase [Bacteroidales bacterium]